MNLTRWCAKSTRSTKAGVTDHAYPPPVFTVDDGEDLKTLLRAAGLATLVSHGSDGIVVTHLPLIYDETANLLVGHMSRKNPHPNVGAGEALALFHNMDAYVTPGWYPSKAVHGRVAPTWNYEFLHVRGQLRWIEDRDWLLANVSAVTDRFESDQPNPWKVSDAPSDYVDKLLSAIIGVEIVITSIECRRKMSQNQREDDRQGAIAGLAASPKPGDRQVGEAMRALYPAAAPE